MDVFATALATLHADRNMGQAADYRRPPYVWQPVRVILSRPTDVLGNIRAGSLMADIPAAAITVEPQRGDELRLDGVVYVVDDPERDVLALSWRLTLADRN